MELNDNKAGMQGLDKQRINAIIEEASKGSKFYQHKQQKDEKMKARIENQRLVLETLTPVQIERAEKEMDTIARELEETRDLSQIIVHIDMDAYYAAVEMRDNPSLRNVPMAVGGNSMLSTSNYPARRYGVRAAMPGFIARKLCPELIIVPCNFNKYTSIAKEIRKIFAEYDPNFSPMSLDEAYLNITNCVSSRSGAPAIHKRKRFAGDCNCMLPRFNGDLIIEGEKFDRAEMICQKCLKLQVILNDTVEFGHTAEEVTKELRFRIEQQTGGLTASAGIQL